MKKYTSQKFTDEIKYKVYRMKKIRTYRKNQKSVKYIGNVNF